MWIEKALPPVLRVLRWFLGTRSFRRAIGLLASFPGEVENEVARCFTSSRIRPQERDVTVPPPPLPANAKPRWMSISTGRSSTGFSSNHLTAESRADSYEE